MTTYTRTNFYNFLTENTLDLPVDEYKGEGTNHRGILDLDPARKNVYLARFRSVTVAIVMVSDLDLPWVSMGMVIQNIRRCYLEKNVDFRNGIFFIS